MENRISSEILDKVKHIEIRSRRLVNEALAGRYHSVFKGCGMNFDEVREYSSGDDIRSIDWNVTARMGRPFIKKFVEERELTILLLIDLSASGEFGSIERSKREIAAEVGSILAFSALKNSDKVGLVLFTSGIELYIPPKKGKSHILRIIREILFFKPKKRGTDIGSALDFVSKIIHRKAVVFLLSDFCLSKDYEQSLIQLKPKLQTSSRRHDLVAISINDLCEEQLPALGVLNLEDAETGEQVELNCASSLVQEALLGIRSEQRKSLSKTMLASGIDLLELKTDGAYLSTLLRFFGEREQRAQRLR